MPTTWKKRVISSKSSKNSETDANATAIIALLILLAGCWLRFAALARDLRFHPDEALFSTFARGAALNGDWWLPGPLDKTPLALYVNAIAQIFIGDTEFAARLPGTLASILLLAVIYAVARRLSGTPAALIALGIAAASPFALAFSATALTDGLMLLALALALWLALRGEGLAAGLWLGVGFACKQQALYYVPLVLLLGLLGQRFRLVRFTAGLMSVILLVILWDHLRGETSIFVLAAANNTPGGLISAGELLPRLRDWLIFASELLGPAWLTALLGSAALILSLRRVTTPGLLLAAYSAAYFGLHWLVAFNTYDRYLLLLLPPLIWLAASGLAHLPRRAWLIPLLLIGGLQATQTRLNDGGTYYTGIDEVAAYLNAQPVAAVIYDHWLGWELDYYLGEWHDKRRVYYPEPAALVRDALALCEYGARYFPVPRTAPVGPWLAALENAGFAVATGFSNPRFVVYTLSPPWVAGDASNVAAHAAGAAHHCPPLAS